MYPCYFINKSVSTSYQQTFQLSRATDIFKHTENYQGVFQQILQSYNKIVLLNTRWYYLYL